MESINLVKKKINSVSNFFYLRRKISDLSHILNSASLNNNRIYFFCTPIHSNLGDQAQLYCWLQLFREWYPNYEVVCIPTRGHRYDTIMKVHEMLQKNDIIYIHSGYLIYDYHPELPFILEIVRGFYDRHVVILPQTVNLMSEWSQHVVAEVFNAHHDLTLICRDEVSLNNARSLFPNISNKVMPDVVTSLIGNMKFQFEGKRDGILFCIRNDSEKYYKDEQILELRKRFYGIKTEMYDTTIDVSMCQFERERESLLCNILRKFAQFQIIITDRYHGTIFSQIANTPVIVLDSTDHKLKSGVEWFPKDLFARSIFFARNLEEAYGKAIEILSYKGYEIKNPLYFKDKYYSSSL